MGKQLIFVANWKLNLLQKEIHAFAEEMSADLQKLAETKNDLYQQIAAQTIVVLPPFVYMQSLIQAKGTLPLYVGAQNIFFKNSGPYTGEVTAQMVQDLGSSYVLIGHSDRRQHFQETGHIIHKKMEMALETGLRPILCIGETKEEKEKQVTEMSVVDQIESACEGFSAEQARKIILAYEPVWAIGSGKSATPDETNDVHTLIRKVLTRNWGLEMSKKIPVIYGGSVRSDNVAKYLMKPDVDGVLIGAASAQWPHFYKTILNAVKCLHKMKSNE